MTSIYKYIQTEKRDGKKYRLFFVSRETFIILLKLRFKSFFVSRNIFLRFFSENRF